MTALWWVVSWVGYALLGTVTYVVVAPWTYRVKLARCRRGGCGDACQCRQWRRYHGGHDRRRLAELQRRHARAYANGWATVDALLWPLFWALGAVVGAATGAAWLARQVTRPARYLAWHRVDDREAAEREEVTHRDGGVVDSW